MRDQDWMQLALDEAALASSHDDVPVGAVAVKSGKVVGKAHNERQLRQDPTAHAEILALRAAAEQLGTWRLSGVALYVTLEPCPMCAGAMVAGRVRRLIYGAADPKAGAAWSLYNIPGDPRLNHSSEIKAGVLAEECTQLLHDFFRKKRRRTSTL